MAYLNENNEPVAPDTLNYDLGYLTLENNGNYQYHLFNAVQLAERRIPVLKEQLANTDYQAIKYAEGQLSADDYAETKAQRQTWRDEINRLEQIVNGG